MHSGSMGRLYRALLAVVLVCTVATGAKAQDIPTVFAHGVKSTGDTWDFLAGNLSSYLRITPVATTTPWTKTETTQASSLIQSLNANPNTGPGTLLPFVAHSNGGLVSRQFSTTDPRLRNLATVATPHAGVRLANNFINGELLGYFGHLGSALGQPVIYYAQNDPAWPDWMVTAIDRWDGWWNPITSSLGQANGMLCDVLGMCYTVEDGILMVAPVLRDVAEGSARLGALNSSSNLNREASAIANRVYLYTIIEPENGLFHLLFPQDYQTWGTRREVTEALYWIGYDYYSDHSTLWPQAYLWRDGAEELAALDINWNELLGTMRWDIPPYLTCAPTQGCHWVINVWGSDGVIDHRSAGFAQAHARLIRGNLAHTEHLNSPTVASAVGDVLEFDFLIPRRSDPPPPPPPSWSVIIHGPTSAQPGNTCYWYAGSNVADANYEWSVDGTVLGSAQDFWYTASSSFTLRVQLWNAQGHGGQKEISVNISSENGQCVVV